MPRRLCRTPGARAILAEQLAYAGRPDEGLALLRELVEEDPEDHHTRLTLVGVLYDAGRYRASLDACDALLEDGLDSGEVYLYRAMNCYALDWLADAEEALEAALERHPANPSALELRELLTFEIGEGATLSLDTPLEPVPIPDAHRGGRLDASRRAELEPWGAYYLNRIEAVQFLRGREQRVTDLLEVEILSPAGLDLFGSIEVPFDPLGETLYVNRLSVRDAEGREVFAGSEPEYYVRDLDTGMATQDKQVVLPVRGLEVGGTVELMTTRLYGGDAQRLAYTEGTFSRLVPVANAVFSVRGDVEQLRYAASEGVELERGPDALVWRVREPEPYAWEPAKPPYDRVQPLVDLADGGASWAEEGRTYLAEIAPRMELQPEVERRSAALLADDPDADPVDVLSRFVQDALVYHAIEFGRRGTVPNDGATVLANRYGDCKDHAVLLRGLLQAAGVESHLVLVNTQRSVREELPTLDPFDHMILHVPDADGAGPGRFIDCVAKEFDLSAGPPVWLGGRRVLVLDPAEPRFVTIPGYPTDCNRVESRQRATLLEDGDVRVEETVRFHGYVAGFQRGNLDGLEPALQRMTVESQITGYGAALDLERLELRGLGSTVEPLELELAYTLRGAVQPIDGQLVGRLPALWERSLLEPPPAEGRRSDYDSELPLRVETELLLRAPEGLRLQPPQPSEGQNALGRWSLAAEPDAAGDGALLLRRRVESPPLRVPRSEYDAFAEAAEQALRGCEVRLLARPR